MSIVTTLEGTLTGVMGTSRITDTTEHDDLVVFSIVPESDTVINELTHVGPNGEQTDATSAAGRNLGSLTAGRIYLAGKDSYFKKIKLTSGSISIHQ